MSNFSQFIPAATPSVIAGSQTLTSTATLTSASPALNLLNFSSYGGSVTLPDATTLATGGVKYILDNSQGTTPVGVLNSSGQVMGQIAPGTAAQFHLTDASTVAGVWRHTGELDPVWINNEITLNLTRLSAAAIVHSIDATRCLLYWVRQGDSYPMGRVITWSSVSSVPTVSAEIVLKASATTIASNQVYALGTSRALIRFADNTCAVLDTSSPAIGTSQSVSFTAGSLSIVQALDSQYVIAAAIDNSSFVVRAKCLDCGASGTTLTVGAEAVSSSAGSASLTVLSNGGVQAVSSMAIGIIGHTLTGGTYYSYWAFMLTRSSGTTLSFSSDAGSPSSIRTTDTNQNTSDIHPTTSSSALLYYWSNSNLRYAVITFAVGTASWSASVASGVATTAAHSFSFAASPNRTRFVTAQTIGGSTCQIEALTVSGSTVTVGAATSFSSENSASSPSVNAFVTNEGRGIIHWRGQAFSSGIGDKLRLFTLSGTTFTFGTEPSSSYGGMFATSMTNLALSSLQGAVSNNLFLLRGGSSGTPQVNRVMVFTISASATMDLVAEVETSPSAGVTGRNTSDSFCLLETNSDSSTRAERVWVSVAAKRIVRSYGLTFKLSATAHNGQRTWANLQRPTGLGVLSPYTVAGGNAILQTHRLAEV